MQAPSAGGVQDTLALPLSMLNGWLFGVDVNRVREEVRPRLIQYQRECFDVLARHFLPFAALQPAALPAPTPSRHMIEMPGGISREEARHLYTLVERIERRGGISYDEAWARLNKHFGVPYHMDIPRQGFQAARDFLLQLMEEFRPAPTLRGRRWLIATDTQGQETVQPIGDDEFVSSWEKLVAGIESGECLRTSAELLAMAVACTRRVQHRKG